ncbi:MAG: AmmeMemoRadiSam system protein A, partial [Bacillota bacterium]
GALVPLYFLNQQGIKHHLVWVAIGLLSSDELYSFGLAIQRAITKTQRRTVVLVSGDLSHRLTEDAPAGYDPRGQEFDRLVESSLADGQFMALLDVDEKLSEAAGECGLRPIQIGLGALDGYQVKSEVLSYEGPYGVGYLTALLTPGTHDQPSLLASMRQQAADRVATLRGSESAEVQLARTTLERYVRTGATASVDELPTAWQRRAGVFVSIKKKGQLRGCIGTIEAVRANLAEEIIHNAISAGTEDPRFAPVQEDELNQLVYSVDVLGESEPIASPDVLDPHRYGVIVRSGRKSGLLLPNLDGIDTAEEQLEIVKQKAGLRPGEPIKLWRFEVVRYH